MSERKTPWTPGPWHIVDRRHTPWTDALVIEGTNEDGENVDIAYTTRGFEGDDDGGLPSWKNARLIAEAPAMAKLLERLARYLDEALERLDLPGDEHPAVIEARALLVRIGVP